MDAERALFNGELASTTVLAGIVSAVAVSGFGLFVGTRAMKRST